MKSYEIESNCLVAGRLIQEFIDGDLEQQDFCSRVKEVTTPLLDNGLRGVRGILKSYPSAEEKARGLVHEALHYTVNRVCGVPSAGIGAIKEDDKDLVWGFTIMDAKVARTTPNLRTKLKNAQRLHALIEKLNI